MIPLNKFGEHKIATFMRNANAILASTDDSPVQMKSTDMVNSLKILKDTLYRSNGGSKPIDFVAPDSSFLRDTISTTVRTKRRQLEVDFSLLSGKCSRKCLIMSIGS
jgi:hypothetical protein